MKFAEKFRAVARELMESARHQPTRTARQRTFMLARDFDRLADEAANTERLRSVGRSAELVP